MFFDEIIHGTQYYRSPTPLPEEWEEDISNLEKFNLDALQIRINWRQNERVEGEYDFSDVDRLMELAEKYNRKVIIKFLLECAPQYVFDKYGGARIGPKGEVFRGGYHGAFYGGWKPCFTNPYVKTAAEKFVGKVVERYHGRDSIILWNVWNEPRNRPVEECFCPHCRAGFGKYLKEKYHTIEALNARYGATEESFESVNLPAMPHGYWDIFEFKKFKAGRCIYEDLRFVYDKIREYDKVRPIMSHVGFTCGFQLALSDLCDDFTAKKAVDFWGTSIPCDTTMDTHAKRLDFQMLGDFLRCVDKNYFLHEIYPGLGRFRVYDTRFDMNFKLYSAISSGAKGLVYWQYRAERVGMECDCSGIMYMDGTPREVAYEVQEIGGALKEDKAHFSESEAEKADVAIVFDFDNLLVSVIEDSCGTDYSFDFGDPKFQYRNTHAGMYRLLRDNNYKVDYLGVRDLDKFAEYKVLYFPYHQMITNELREALESYVKNGGVVIADEGFGLRQTNTWMQPYDLDVKPLLTARMRTRLVSNGNKVAYNGLTGEIRPYKTVYEAQGAEVLARFDDEKPALQKFVYGKGAVYLFGFSVGYAYYHDGGEIWHRTIADIVDEVGVSKYSYADVKNSLYEKRLEKENEQIVFLFNASKETKTVCLKEKIVKVGGAGKWQGNELTLAPETTAYAVVEKL
ncbi:MAG: beta-galactosidase [Clostridia bacterium]|nr:beta-galactosidase [Clostridia bacterium]